MKYVILLIVFDLVQHCTYGVATVSENKRQAGQDPWEFAACSDAYTSLSTEDRSCFTSGLDISSIIGGGLLSASDLVGICANEHCMRVATALLETCKDVIQPNLPEDYQDVSAEALVYYFCANDLSGVPCYSQLPLNTDVLTSCQTVLTGDICSQGCRKELAKYNATCCFATLLSLQPNTGRSQLNKLWNICGIDTQPILCNLGMPDTSSSDAHSGKDESSGSNLGYVAAGVGGFLILVVVVTVIIVTIVTVRKRSRTRYSMNSGDVVRMPLATDDPDD